MLQKIWGQTTGHEPFIQGLWDHVHYNQPILTKRNNKNIMEQRRHSHCTGWGKGPCMPANSDFSFVSVLARELGHSIKCTEARKDWELWLLWIVSNRIGNFMRKITQNTGKPEKEKSIWSKFTKGNWPIQRQEDSVKIKWTVDRHHLHYDCW